LTNQGLVSALELESDVLAQGLSVARRAQSDEMISFVESINRFVVVRDEAGKHHFCGRRSELRDRQSSLPGSFRLTLLMV